MRISTSRQALKEMRLRLFVLRVLLAIYADKALRKVSRKVSLCSRRAAQAAPQVAKSLLQKVAHLLAHILLPALLRQTHTVTRFLLFALLRQIRTSGRFLRGLCLKNPRLVLGSALVALSLLSIDLATGGDAGSSRLAIAEEPQLSLLLQVEQGDKLPQRQLLQSHLKQAPSLQREDKQTASQQAALSHAPTHLSADLSARLSVPLPVRTEYRVLEHRIRSSLYETALGQGIALPLLQQFVDVMSYDVDFQRDIWVGARFRMLLSQQFRLAKNGAWLPLAEPALEVAELYTGRQQYRYYRSGWNDAFYDESGKPAKRFLRRTPMSGLRLTSRFGMRRHPILGYTRIHKGVDFAAPRGTSVLAAGDGVVRKKAYDKGYGRHVLLRHNERLSTLYAHMRGFARGLREGTRVKQGQVIGYVGTSGMSTGPHLHYEIHRNGRAVNPRRVKLPKPNLLEESKRAQFSEKRREDEMWLARGGSDEGASALAALRDLGCELWGGMCDEERRAQR